MLQLRILSSSKSSDFRATRVRSSDFGSVRPFLRAIWHCFCFASGICQNPTSNMPNVRFSEAGVSCWFCVREDEWAFRGDDPFPAEYYGYVRVGGLLIPACEPCARSLAESRGKKFDFVAWRQEAFLQHERSCKY